MRTPTLILAITIIALSAVSCQNDLDFKKTKGGMPYKIFPSEKGEPLKPGDFVKAHIIQELKDSVSFNTRDGMPVYFRVDSVGRPYDPSEIFTQLKTGDSVIAVQMIDTFLKRFPGQVPPHLKNGDRIVTRFRIVKKFASQEESAKDEAEEAKNMREREVAILENYLKENNISATKTANGNFVEIKTEGEGPAIESNNYVTLMYTGRTLEGEVFDSNIIDSFGHTDPLSFVVDRSGMIQGFHEAIKLMRKGSKGVFYLPGSQAYGANPPPGPIKPNQPLIFDIEVVNVQDEIPLDTSEKPPPPSEMHEH